MILKTIIFVFATTLVGADYEDVDNQFVLDKASDALALICESKEPVRIGCRECSCSSNGYEVECKTLDDCSENDSPSLLDAPPLNAPPLAAPPLANNDDKNPNNERPIVCEPQTTFPEYCNHCSCSNDGRIKACTVKYCPPGVFKKDGSLNKDPNLLSTGDVMFHVSGDHKEIEKTKYALDQKYEFKK